MFTKTQAEILKIFVSQIDRRFSIKEIAEMLKKPYPLIHRSIQDLLKKGFLIKDEKHFLSLNYRKNHTELGYVEALRSKQALDKDKILSLFLQDVKNKLSLNFFVLLIFGSYVEKSNPRDIDIILILEDEKRLSEVEKTMQNIASQFTKNFEIQVVSTKSAHEMLAKRENLNILNESLNKHLVLFGAENYYWMVSHARQ
ncbi:hypothetical protein COU54_03365 [Candidatus Pacearchaeota archaeon CG10_big_fil_rev_8_21_14_0_10_31_24]|nr:MAG: hypothetical protein COU54_03365 [Candidatus Pacearchaeota archaeon CG10_big_fil_rev_8_21_14_0_10_31_24]